MKGILVSLSGWFIALLLGFLLFFTGQAGAHAAVDDIQLRAYHSGWGVVVEQPIFGQSPAYYTFPFTTGAHDRYKLGNHDVDIAWGAGPSGSPLVTIDPSTGDK